MPPAPQPSEAPRTPSSGAPRFGFLFWLLLERDLKERYAGAWMGLFWGVLQPAAQFGVYVVVFSVYLKVRPGGAYQDLPFSAWLLAGLLPWLFVAEVLTRAPGQVVEHARLVTKNPFPNELLPWVTVASAAVNHGISLLLLLAALPCLGAASWGSLPALLPWTLLLIVFVLGLALWASAIGVYFRDLIHLAPMLAMVWNFATPIAYPEQLVPPGWRWLLALNPVRPVVQAYRAALLGRVAFDWPALGCFSLWALGLALSGTWVFKKLRPGFADLL